MKNRTLKYLITGSILFLVLLFVGNVLIIGQHFQTLHPAVGWTFYVLVLLFAGWLILSPIWDYMTLHTVPVSVITDSDTAPEYKACQRLARHLAASPALSEEEQAQLLNALESGSDLLPLLKQAYEGPVKTALDTATRQTARSVFVACAVSQSTHLDAIIVLVSNIKLVQNLIRLTGYRPNWLQLVRLHLNIFLTALLVEALEDIDLGDFLASLNTMPTIPGLNFAAQAILHGIGCTFFTVRIGLITRKYLYLSPEKHRNNQLRRSAFQEAIPILRKIVSETFISLKNRKQPV